MVSKNFYYSKGLPKCLAKAFKTILAKACETILAKAFESILAKVFCLLGFLIWLGLAVLFQAVLLQVISSLLLNTGWFFSTVPPNFQYWKEKCCSTNEDLLYIKNFMEQNLWLAAHLFSFRYWKLGGTVKKAPCIFRLYRTKSLRNSWEILKNQTNWSQ